MNSIIFALVISCLAGSLQASSIYNDVHSRIINGNIANSNQFPWHASIQSNIPNGESILCGGALVAPGFVITAAHCVLNVPEVRIGLGSINLSAPQISLVEVSRVIHPLYNPITFANDIAVIRLPLNLTNSATIAPIRLPSTAQTNSLFVNEPATLSGFGRESDSGAISSTLRFAASRVITNAECVNTFGQVFISNNILCAVGRDLSAQGPCSNDNGGPLVLSETTGNTLIGINSFISKGGCSAGHPAAYTRLSLYSAWISQQVGIPVRPN